MTDFPSEALPAILSALRGSDLRTLLALLSVSKQWREAALADAALWTSIVVPPSLAPRLTDERLRAILLRAQRRGFDEIDLTGCVQLTVESLDAILEECARFPRRLSFVGCPQLHWTHVLALLEKLQTACQPLASVALRTASKEGHARVPVSQHCPAADGGWSESYLELPGGKVIRNPHLPRANLLGATVRESAPVSARAAPKLVRPERRLRELGVAGIDFRRCKWRELRTLQQYAERLDVGECEDERCFQIRRVAPCASCLCECCEQHLYRCSVCGGRTCREHCFDRTAADTEPRLGVCYRCHLRGRQHRLAQAQESMVLPEVSQETRNNQ
ncbi:hypothetical protein KFL_000010090 [Klebsormidium nitens]|uniref:F-box domain-containing protein n=1 Tax=Klebsormidium nitens TaxID=105231 RepID=A0A0U9HK67_KLENI|nr:hypothetical protein KFL_000010090 [Klebsormidium nitens]|eukprot:GAQ77560.1 hypothetical protein KFL_000010090 [Klebsormidium nitens]